MPQGAPQHRGAHERDRHQSNAPALRLLAMPCSYERTDTHDEPGRRGEGDRRPGDVCEHPRSRTYHRGESSRDAQAAPARQRRPPSQEKPRERHRQHGLYDRQHHQVGDRSDDRHAPECACAHRQRRRLCGHGRRKPSDQRTRSSWSRRRQPACHPRSEDHNPSYRAHRELESDVERGHRTPGQNRSRGCSQRSQRVGADRCELRASGDREHRAGADGRDRPCRHGGECPPAGDSECRKCSPPPDTGPCDRQHCARHDADVQTRDRKRVRQAGRPEVCLHIAAGKAPPISKHDATKQRAGVAGSALERPPCPCPPAIQPARRSAAPSRHLVRPRPRESHDAAPGLIPGVARVHRWLHDRFERHDPPDIGFHGAWWQPESDQVPVERPAPHTHGRDSAEPPIVCVGDDDANPAPGAGGTCMIAPALPAAEVRRRTSRSQHEPHRGRKPDAPKTPPAASRHKTRARHR